MRRPLSYVGIIIVVVSALIASVTPAHAEPYRSTQWWIESMDLLPAHTISTGKGISIGLVDTGVSAEHPDLVGSIDPGMATWDGGENGLVDVYGHGTAMASFAVGHGHGDNNEEGILGSAPGARILSAGIMDIAQVPEADDGGSWFGSDDTASAVRWLADNGADIISMSLSGDFGPSLREAVEYATIEKGIPVIACSGNIDPHGEVIQAPAIYDGVLVVSGTEQGDGAWSGAITGPEVDISAPAANMQAADFRGGYARYYGTSNATALVAGVAALVLSQWPNMSREALYARLTQTAKDAGMPGRDDVFGHGIIDPVAALTQHVDPPSGLTDAEVNPGPFPEVKDIDESDNSLTLYIVGVGALAFIVWVSGWIGWSMRRRHAESGAPSSGPVLTSPYPPIGYGPPPPPPPPNHDPNLSGPRRWE